MSQICRKNFLDLQKLSGQHCWCAEGVFWLWSSWAFRICMVNGYRGLCSLSAVLLIIFDVMTHIHTHTHTPFPLIDSAHPVGGAEWKFIGEGPVQVGFLQEENNIEEQYPFQYLTSALSVATSTDGIWVKTMSVLLHILFASTFCSYWHLVWKYIEWIKGSRHFKKVQFFWTLFKRPLTPPLFIWTFVLFCRGCFLKRVFEHLI